MAPFAPNLPADKAVKVQPKAIRPPRPVFKCRKCGTDKCFDTPMIKNEIWLLISQQVPLKDEPERDLLCLKCTEELLGRKLTVDDLADCPANEFTIIAVDRAIKLTPVPTLEGISPYLKRDIEKVVILHHRVQMMFNYGSFKTTVSPKIRPASRMVDHYLRLVNSLNLKIFSDREVALALSTAKQLDDAAILAEQKQHKRAEEVLRSLTSTKPAKTEKVAALRKGGEYVHLQKMKKAKKSKKVKKNGK